MSSTKNLKTFKVTKTGELRYTTEFHKLQQEWYGKLKDSGFQDIEYTNANMPEESVMKAASGVSGEVVEQQNKLHYYRILTNFLAHNPNYGINKKTGKRNRTIVELYCEGVAYRTIPGHTRCRYYKPFSYNVVFRIVNKFIPKALAWNKQNPEGLDYEAK